MESFIFSIYTTKAIRDVTAGVVSRQYLPFYFGSFLSSLYFRPFDVESQGKSRGQAVNAFLVQTGSAKVSFE